MQDVKGYIERLDKSMTRQEKLFFFNKVKLASYDFIVDFGCADGRMLYEIDKRLKDKAKNLRLIGIEKNDDIAIDYNFVHQFRRHKTVEDLPLSIMKKKKVLFILSSVLHELDTFERWYVFDFAEMCADTVVIRDMYYQSSNFTLRREQKQATNFVMNELHRLSRAECRLFNDIYRPTIHNKVSVKKLYEFFLKYTYKENWATEKQENYFSDNVRWLVDELRKDKVFKLKYLRHYMLPYKRKKVYLDFGYKMRINTHVKLILKRKRSNHAIR